MTQILDTGVNVDVLESEYVRLLGYPRDHEMTGRALELASNARAWYAKHGRPWVFARRADDLRLTEDGFDIEGVSFSSRRLRRTLEQAGAHAVMLAAVSAGPECEAEAARLWREQKPDEYFFLEVFGSAVVEQLVTALGGQFCAEADLLGEAVLPHYSPGYPDWDIADQKPLMELVRSGGPALDLDVLQTGMLRPKKSLLAVFGLTGHVDRVERLTGLVPCTRCSLGGCSYRRAAYRASSVRVGEVERLQRANKRSARARAGIALNHDARYSVGVKALRIWTENRLELTLRDDRSVEAVFTYEGTTCSNLGYPLKFDYRVTLDRPESGYRILSASCEPSPGDNGYTRMCKYLKDPGALMSAIDRKIPLLGRPLDEVFDWERKFIPTGCYCDAAGRSHKWGLALEAIHYALVMREKNSLNEPSEGSSRELQP